MSKNRWSVLVGLGALAVWSASHAQLDLGGAPLDSCGKIDALQKAKKYNEARDEANRCLQGIEQALQGSVGNYFKQEIAGWMRTGFDQNMVLGFANISATYKKKDVEVSVSLTRGAGGSDAVSSGLGKLLGGIARAGLQSSGRQVRVAGLPASVQQDGSIVVTLEDGAFLSFMSPQLKDQDSALAGMGDLVDAFPVADINKVLGPK
jgi:hypothetical protein